MNTADNYFKETVTKIVEEGFDDSNFEVRPKWPDGTSAHTIKIGPSIFTYDLEKEFPILTLRKQFFKNAVTELLWMWQLKSNNTNDLGLKIWDAWADADGSIGKTYGYQLGKVSKFAEGNMDQVDRLIYLLKNKPMDRRMITTMWCPEDLSEMNLPPCVYETLWDVTDGRLNLTLIQRSGDLLAAAAPGGWDCIQYAVLVHLLAQTCGYKPGKMTHIIHNLHIYDRHVRTAIDLCSCNGYTAPKIWINPEVTDFYKFSIDDIKLIDYNYNDVPVKFEVAI